MMFLGWLVVAIFTAVIAASKNRSTAGWFVLGFLFSIIALIAVACMPKIEDVGEAQRIAAEHKKCPYCKELIKVDAIKCKHCGSELQTRNSPKNLHIFDMPHDVNETEVEIYNKYVAFKMERPFLTESKIRKMMEWEGYNKIYVDSLWGKMCPKDEQLQTKEQQ